jgi:dCMP deaminase
MERPSWDEYFMRIAFLIAERSTCLRRKVGAVIVKDKRILSTGYNGAPSGIQHCAKTECIREKLKIPTGERHELCKGLHGEQNAIIQAAKMGVIINKASIYITNFPCFICSKQIINAGLKEVIYANPYNDKLSQSILKEAKIKIRKFTPKNSNNSPEI